MSFIPINSVAWLIGSIATYRFGARGWQAYLKNKNPVAKIYALLALFIGSAFLFYAAPLISKDLIVLKHTFLTGDVFVELGIQTLVWLVWYLMFKQYIKLWYLLPFSIVFSLIIISSEASTISVIVDPLKHIITYQNESFVLKAQAIYFVLLPLPLSIYFIRQLPKQSDFNAKAKNITNALVFFSVGLLATLNNLLDKGRDSLTSSIILLVVFSLFLVVSFLPTTKGLITSR